MKLVSWLESSFVMLFLMLTACGGGGGGGSVAAPAAVTYSGATTQAVVTTTNARALSVDAYQGGQTGSTISPMGIAVESGATEPASAPRLLALGKTLKGAVTQLFHAGAPGLPAVAGAIATVTVPGPGGGSLTYTIYVNEVTYAFSGTISFNAYKGELNGPAISGVVTFSGVYNPASETFSSFTISFPSLSVAEGGGTFTACGNVTLTVAGGTETTVISLVLQNSATGKTYWVKDYTYTLNGLGELTLTGTYYDPVHGYVSISTLTPLQVATPDAWPTAGVLLFSGANGSKARLTFTATGYSIEVDLTGSGVFTTVP